MSEKLKAHIETAWASRKDKESTYIIIDPDDIEWTPEEAYAQKKDDPKYTKIWSYVEAPGVLPEGFYWEDIGFIQGKYLQYKPPKKFWKRFQ